MDYFVISSDYPELKKVVQKIFLDIDSIDVISSTECRQPAPRNSSKSDLYPNINHIAC